MTQVTKKDLLSRTTDNLTIKPNAKQREALITFLKQQGISYQVDQVDLEAEFMKYYEDDHA